MGELKMPTPEEMAKIKKAQEEETVRRKEQWEVHASEIEAQIESQGIEIGDYIEIIFDNDFDNESFAKQGPTKFKGFDGGVFYSYYHPKNNSYVAAGKNSDKIKEIRLVQKANETTEQSEA